MPDFRLEQMDGEEGATIDLPHGETVIGRGPFLNVSDKRVSRIHGILENMDRQLRLKPIHVNPCFVQTSRDASPQPLERDQWQQLMEGSIFSLLPGKYIYRVHAVVEGRTPRNSQGFEEEEENDKKQISKSSRSCEDTLAYTPSANNGPSCTFGASTPKPAAFHKVGGDSCISDAPNPLTPRKARVLPAWMMATTPAALNTSKAKAATKHTPTHRAPNATPSSKCSAGSKRPLAQLPSSSADEQEEKGVIEDEDEEIGCSKAPNKRARRLISDPEESQDHVPAHVATSPERSQLDKDANAARKPDKQDEDKEKKKADKSQVSNARESTSTPENSGTSGANLHKAKVQQRTPCPYGSSCYRKNPIHFQECSHPGDEDYEEEQTNTDDDYDDDRPECPYGTDCYRMNPLHKKEYKHTQPPVRTSRLVNDDDDDDDDDQYENSFINDDSEEDDMVEDSDYVPELEDSEKEDFKRLHKEAKAFIQKKKKK